MKLTKRMETFLETLKGRYRPEIIERCRERLKNDTRARRDLDRTLREEVDADSKRLIAELIRNLERSSLCG